MLDHKPSIEGIGVVVVELCALLIREFWVSFVVEVVADSRHIIILECLLQTLYKSTLAGACTSCYTDYYNIFHIFRLLSIDQLANGAVFHKMQIRK